MPTNTCNTREVTSDKIILETGQKNITILGGQKGGTDGLLGTVDKIIYLGGKKNISVLLGSTGITLTGEKYILDLTGTKLISTLTGTLNKGPILIGTACEGIWYVHCDTTYKTADDCFLKADNCG